MDNKTYLIESERTAASTLHRMFDDQTILATLQNAVKHGQEVDKIKKGLYYGKPCNLSEIGENDTEYLESIADNVNIDILHGVLGVFTESVEMIEAVLKTMEHPPTHEMYQKMDDVNMVEEIGDMEWYLAMLYRSLETYPEVAKQINIDKLRARYPGKFTTDAAINRDTDTERTILENG